MLIELESDFVRQWAIKGWEWLQLYQVCQALCDNLLYKGNQKDFLLSTYLPQLPMAILLNASNETHMYHVHVLNTCTELKLKLKLKLYLSEL